MKKLFYLFAALMISQNLLAGNVFWTGATSSNWNTGSNWDTGSVPTSADDVYLNSGSNQVVISSGTVTVKSVQIRANQILTVNSGATLRLIGDVGAYAVLLMIDNSSVVNNGTIALETSGGGSITGWFIPSATTTFTNNGTLRINTTFTTAIEMGNHNNNTGQAKGIATIINNACGKMILTNGNFIITSNTVSNVTNYGLIQVEESISGAGTFINAGGGVIKRVGDFQTITSNNGSVIINNNPTASTIFSYTGTFLGTVDGIYTNTGATATAGTFVAPNTFTPSGALPIGSQTLYAKITPSGGACSYVVPFTYNNVAPPPSITATGTLSAFSTCSGTASAPQSFSVSGSNLTANITVAAPTGFEISTSSGGTYSSSLTLTQSGGTVSNASIFVRLRSTATGNPSGNVACTSNGATTRNVAATGTVTNIPGLTVGIATNPSTCGGTNGSIAFTTTNLPNGTYSLSYTGTGSPKSITVSGNAFSLTGLSAGNYSNFSVTSAGCTGTASTSRTLTAPATPTLTVGTATNPTTCAGTNGNIAFTSTNLPNGTYQLSFTATGAGATTSPQNVTVSNNAFSLSGLKAGTYSNFSVTSAGCTGTVATSRTLTDPAIPTLTVGIATNPSTCGGTGSIAFTTTNLPNGTYSLSYTGTGSPKSITVSGNAFSLTGLSAGNYSNFSVTSAGCTGTASTSRTLTAPATPTLTVGTATNPTTCAGTNGNIAFTSTNLPNGTYQLSFTATGAGATASPQNITVSGNIFSLTGLKAGAYSNFSVTNAGCTGTASTSRTLTDPAAPTLTVGTATNPTTCAGTNGSIAFTSTNLPNGTYSLSFTATGAGATTSPQNVTVSGNAFTLSGLKAGTYSVFSVTNAGCTGSAATTRTLTDPATPTLTVGTATNPTTCGGTNGSIAFTSTNLPNGTYSLSFTSTGAGATTSPQSITVSGNAFSLTGLSAGNYSNFSVTSAGCTGTASTSRTLTAPATPTLTVGTATNPTTCAGTNGNIAFTSTNLPNGTYQLSFTATGAGATASPQNITVSGNIFSLTGLKAGAYSNFSVTNAGCTGTASTSRTLTDPAAPTLTVGTATNPTTCAGTNGSIAFTSTNLPNGTYSLSFTATGAGATTSPQNVTVSGNAFTLAGLKAGTYSDFSVTNTGCTGTVATSRTLTDPATPIITAGTVLNPATCGATGSIPFTSTNLPNGTYSLSFTATGAGATTSPQNVTVTSNTFSLTGLSVGNYSNFSLISTGCTATDATSKSIANPATPTLTLGGAVNPTVCGGTDGSIPFTTNLPDGTYSLSYTGTGSPKSITVSSGAFTLGTLGSGGYNNFSVTNNGCTGTSSVSRSLSDPAAPVLTLGTTSNPTACNLSNGSIAFTTTNITDGTYSLTYSGAGSPQSITVSENNFTLSGLADGTYSNFSITNGSGCTGSLATPVTLVDLALPVLTVGASTNPTTCLGTNGSIAFTSANLPDGTYSLSFTTTATASPKSVNVATNSFTLSGLSAGTYSNFSVIRTGCTGTVATSRILSNPASPSLTAGTSTNPTTCSGTDGTIAFTTTNLANGTYSLSFTTTGTSSPKSVFVTNNTFTLTGLSAGNYSAFSITTNGCTGSDATLKTLSNPASPTITAGLVTAPTSCSAADGSIAFTSTNLPDGTYTLTYTGAGSPKTVTITSNAFSLTGLDDGTYNNFSITNLGCTASDATGKTVSNPTPPTLTAGTVTNPTTCGEANGSIPFTTTLPNGTYTLNYTGAGSPRSITVASGTFSITGLSAGTFSGFSITNAGCTSTDASTKTLSDPTAPTLIAGTATNPTTCASTDGAIAFTTSLANGTYSLSYTGSGSPKSITVASGAFNLTGLPDGTFSGFSVTTGGCTGIANVTKTLTDPAAPTLTAGTATNPTTCASTDGSIAFTTSLPNGTYSLSYTGSGSPKSITVVSGAFNLTGLPNGTFSGFSVTTGGCTGISSATKTLTDPAGPTLTAGTATNPTTCSGTDGIIAFTTTLPNGTYSLSYTGSGSPKSITVASSAFTLSGLSAGDYSGFSVTTGGCTGTSSSTKTLTNPTTATLTAGTVTNPTTCASTNGSIAFTTTLPNGTYSLNYTGSGSPKSITVANGAFNLTGLPDGTFSGFSITVAGCTSTDATTKTLTDPAAPTLTAGAAINPSTCASTDGSVAFTTSLPNGTYSLSYTGSGSPQNITVVNGAFTLGNLPDGTFSGFSVTTGGCTGTSSAIKTLTDPAAPTLTAGTATNPTTCSGTDGTIAFTTTLPNGIYSLSYTGSGSPKSITVAGGTFTLTDLSAGTYNGFLVITGGCTGIDNTTKTLTDPASPTIIVGTATNPTTCVGSDGSIAFSSTNLPNGTYSLSFTGAGSPKSITVSSNAFSLTGLSAGIYSGFSLANAGCTAIDARSKTLTEPNAPTITAGTATNPTTCGGTNGSIAFTTTNLTNGSYTLNYKKGTTAQTASITVASNAFTLSNLTQGSYSDFSITNAGCTGSDATVKTLTDPNSPMLTAGTATNPTICGGTNGSISFTTNLTDGMYSISYTGTGSPQNVSVAGGSFSLTGLTAGIYSGFSVTVSGCTGTDAGSKTLTDPNCTQIIYINAANTNTTQNGNSWVTAYASLSAGLSAAALQSNAVQVWVAKGTYKPGTLRRDVFSIPSGVEVYGGFVGSETELNQRNWNTATTILSGEIGTASLSDNVNHVVVFNQTAASTRLDGFTIEKGFADYVSPTQNTELADPSVLSSGGGIVVINKSQGLITNCVITNNKSIAGGGILLRDSSQVSVTKSIVWGNEATFGGGVYVLGGSTPELVNVLIVSNKALGGGVYINRSSPQLVNCTIASNQGTNGTAGGIFNSNASGTVKNSIVWGNSSPQSTPGIVMTYSLVEGGFTGTGNLNLNPLFVNASPSGLAPQVTLGDYHVQVCSPAINAGDNSDAPTQDLEGNVRPYPAGAPIVDMGAYESQSTGGGGPATLTVTEPIMGGSVLKSGGRITATNQVTGGVVEYRGGESVTLLPGFVASGTTFQAVIGGCETAVPTSVQGSTPK